VGRCDCVPGPVLLLHPRGLGELQGCHSLPGREGGRERQREKEEEDQVREGFRLNLGEEAGEE
jgi:hypothetical protein